MDEVLLVTHISDAASGSASVIKNLLDDAVVAAEEGRFDRCEKLLRDAVSRADSAKHDAERALEALNRYQSGN